VAFAGPESGLSDIQGYPSLEVTNVDADFRATTGFREDLAPAERKRIQQQLEQARLAEEQKRLEEMIAKEIEKDPDAVEEDIRQQFYKARTMRKAAVNQQDHDTTSTRTETNFKQPVITLGTTLQTSN
jgi:hypothetical protein